MAVAKFAGLSSKRLPGTAIRRECWKLFAPCAATDGHNNGDVRVLLFKLAHGC